MKGQGRDLEENLGSKAPLTGKFQSKGKSFMVNNNNSNNGIDQNHMTEKDIKVFRFFLLSFCQPFQAPLYMTFQKNEEFFTPFLFGDQQDVPLHAWVIKRVAWFFVLVIQIKMSCSKKTFCK